MDLDRAREFLRRNHRAVLATYHADGRAQLSPVTVGVDDAGHAVIISSRETAVKVRNLRRDPRVAICVLTRTGSSAIGCRSRARRTSSRCPRRWSCWSSYYRGISGEHPDWDDYRAAMERDRRVIVQVTITRAGPDFHG